MRTDEEKSIGRKRKICICAAVLAFFLVLFLSAPKLEKMEGIGCGDSPFFIITNANLHSYGDAIALNDSEPIFLPTEWNFTAPEIKIISKQPFFSEKKIDSPEYAKKTFELKFSNIGKVGERDFIIQKESVFFSFMRADFEPANSFQDGIVNVNIKSIASGEDVFFGKMRPSRNMSGILWKPVEMSVFVDNSGQMSWPFVSSSSGLESFDEELEEYVKNRLSNKVLKKGAYKIIFAP